MKSSMVVINAAFRMFIFTPPLLVELAHFVPYRDEIMLVLPMWLALGAPRFMRTATGKYGAALNPHVTHI
ncbi:MAG: hypothetical protein COA98_02385 [Candidatus Neomarinimicrobiota bacterium]|nr:MAG: hypothetical protein COA98_02385 [Candidatus Neomarinimicrobiota bacterium]